CVREFEQLLASRFDVW
nr:immunoglobulin heavy chain junction region [Macaca mulatta]MOV45753.1 immunoglobulin heavy chain junction region [Macaca mulatta]